MKTHRVSLIEFAEFNLILFQLFQLQEKKQEKKISHEDTVYIEQEDKCLFKRLKSQTTHPRDLCPISVFMVL